MQVAIENEEGSIIVLKKLLTKKMLKILQDKKRIVTIAS